MQPVTRKFRDVAERARTITFAECAQVGLTRFLPPACSFEENRTLDPSGSNHPSNSFRHSDSANVPFVDGHVDSVVVERKAEIPRADFLFRAQAEPMKEKRPGVVGLGRLNGPQTQDWLCALT